MAEKSPMGFEHHEINFETKRPPFHRQHFQLQLRSSKLLYFDTDFTQVYSCCILIQTSLKFVPAVFWYRLHSSLFLLCFDTDFTQVCSCVFWFRLHSSLFLCVLIQTSLKFVPVAFWFRLHSSLFLCILIQTSLKFVPAVFWFRLHSSLFLLYFDSDFTQVCSCCILIQTSLKFVPVYFHSDFTQVCSCGILIQTSLKFVPVVFSFRFQSSMFLLFRLHSVLFLLYFDSDFTQFCSCCILFQTSLKFVPKYLIGCRSPLVHTMAWCRRRHKPLSELIVVYFTDAYVRQSATMNYKTTYAPGRCDDNFKSVIAEHMLGIIFVCT